MTRATKKTLFYVALTGVVLLLGRLVPGPGGTLRGLLGGGQGPSMEGGTSASGSNGTDGGAASPTRATRLRRPPASSVTLGVLTGRAESDVSAAIERKGLAAGIREGLCGDAAACDAVRSTLLDDHATALRVMPLSDWTFGASDLDAGIAALPAGDRGRASRLTRVVSVQVATATSPRQLAVRAAFAAAAAIAERLDGFVHDPLLVRLETASEFVAHAVTAPLDASSFRRDRVEILYEPKDEGVVRLLTAGLSRWGAPDIEAAQVPLAAKARVAELVLAVAEAVADGADSGPCVLSRDEIARVRGAPYPPEPQLPASSPIPVDLVSVRGEVGDPNDFVARIVPPGGDGAIGYLDLAERFFGPLLETATAAADDPKQRDQAQQALGVALERWANAHGTGKKLLVRLPFTIPGDAGIESMWIDVSRYDAQTVGGALVDDPLGATDVSRGDFVTRPRAEVEDVRLLGLDAGG